jgi:ABC-2 type transport system ATP-binding protein
MSATVAIRIENLTKQFRGRFRSPVRAVNQLSLEVEAGQVYGFLGPNGAGKTTTIRMLLDLIRPSQGDVFMFGQNVRRDRSVLGRAGAMVEGAYFYPFLSGRRNLEVMALTSNLNVSEEHITALLKRVDMLERSDRRVKGYSTGMKQRLGLAAALLGDPDLIILDEPTNGLDPHGIHDVREVIRDLAEKHGKTVFLSSHQLSEVEQICSRVAIIDKGVVIREGLVKEIVSGKAQLRVMATPLDKATAILTEHWTTQVGTVPETLLVNANTEDAPTIVEKLVENECKVFEITTQRQSLEDYFIEVTKGENSHVD